MWTRLSRRRKVFLILALLPLSLLAYAFWPHRLSRTERALVGSWVSTQKIGGRYPNIMVLGSDGRCNFFFVDPVTRQHLPPMDPPSRWRVRGQRLVLDHSPDRASSWLNGMSGPLTMIWKPPGHDIQSLGADRLVMAPPMSKAQTLDRLPPERSYDVHGQLLDPKGR